MTSLREWPDGAIRAGVIVCVLVIAVVGGMRLDETLGLFDYRADANAQLGYLDRLYGDGGLWIPKRRVVEDARMWMPEDATFRVVLGPKWENLDGRVVAGFLKYFLLPRRDTGFDPAPWVFCYGCDRTKLGGRFEVLSDGGDDIVFGRMRP